MANVSLAGSGIIVLLVTNLLQWIGIGEVGDVSGAITGMLEFVGWVALIWGQLRRSDIMLGILRRGA